MEELAPNRRAKHAQIIEAAIEVFAEKGFHAARVSDVARRAGVADGTIYLYFKSKDDLLLSIFEQKMDELIDGVRAAIAVHDDPRDKLRAFAAFHFGLVERHRAAAEVLQVELRLSNKFLKEYRPQKLWLYLGVLEDILRDGQARGLFREDAEPFLATWALFGALDELAMQYVLSRRARRYPVEQITQQVTETFLRGLEKNP
jgi:TetR/AcrR family fatty acid metabolism transcriptional regulator